jgi:hypothetical protein
MDIDISKLSEEELKLLVVSLKRERIEHALAIARLDQEIMAEREDKS